MVQYVEYRHLSDSQVPESTTSLREVRCSLPIPLVSKARSASGVWEVTGGDDSIIYIWREVPALRVSPEIGMMN